MILGNVMNVLSQTDSAYLQFYLEYPRPFTIKWKCWIISGSITGMEIDFVASSFENIGVAS